jgi:hypothetical protein
MAHIERINWTDSVPDAVAKIAEGNIGRQYALPDETLRRNTLELPKSNVMLLTPWDIWTKRMGNIQRRLRTEPCKNARSAACHTVGMLSSEALLRFQTAVQK